MNGIVTQYWSIIPGGIHQFLHEPITGVDSFYVFEMEEYSSADWNAESGVNLLARIFSLVSAVSGPFTSRLAVCISFPGFLVPRGALLFGEWL